MPRRYQVHDIDPAPVIERVVVSEAAAFSFPKPRSCRNGAKPRVGPAVDDFAPSTPMESRSASHSVRATTRLGGQRTTFAGRFRSPSQHGMRVPQVEDVGPCV